MLWSQLFLIVTVLFALRLIRAALFRLTQADQLGPIKKDRANETEREYRMVKISLSPLTHGGLLRVGARSANFQFGMADLGSIEE